MNDPLDDSMVSFIRSAAQGPGAYAGVVLWVARGGKVLTFRAHGFAERFCLDGSPLEVPRPMTLDTAFDLASVTKLVTALAVAHLVDRELVDPGAPVGEYLEEFRESPARQVTVEHLLSHTSGFWEWVPLYLYIDRPEDVLPFVAQLPLRYRCGARRAYSDLNFIVLGKLVEIATGMPLAVYVTHHLLGALGLCNTFYACYDPRAETGLRHFAATSLGNPYETYMCRVEPLPMAPRRQEPLGGWRERVLVGEANDGNCYHALEEVSGHAGLFSTAEDLGRLGSLLLSGESLWSRSTLQRFTSPRPPDNQGLGFWLGLLPWAPMSFGHPGFTGTLLVIDPEANMVVVLLSNRLHGTLPYVPLFDFAVPILREVYRIYG